LRKDRRALLAGFSRRRAFVGGCDRRFVSSAKSADLSDNSGRWRDWSPEKAAPWRRRTNCSTPIREVRDRPVIEFTAPRRKGWFG